MMSSNFFNWIIVFYTAGFLISLISSTQSFFHFSMLKKSTNVDIFLVKPGMKFYLISKPIFWPFYFVIEKNPIERFSELFFKHYGDEGHTYFGNQGIKNFLNDVFRSKTRYRNYHTNQLIWALDQESPDYQQCIELLKFKEKPVFALITYARYKEKYLLGVCLVNKTYVSDTKQVSRFELDTCEKMNIQQFRDRLFQINPECAKEFLKHLN